MSKYDLEQRTLFFAQNVRDYVKKISSIELNSVYKNQLLRSSSSVGANYREANEASTKKEFKYRISVCRKEAKETHYWLQLLEYQPADAAYKSSLENEARELVCIFSSILKKA